MERAIAVIFLTAEPFGEETRLRLALIRKIAPEQRPQRRVGFDPVVEPVDQRGDRGSAADLRKGISADKGTMRLRMSQKSTVLHAFLPVLAKRLPEHNLRLKKTVT